MITFNSAWNQVETDKIVLQGFRGYKCAICGKNYKKNDNSIGMCNDCHNDIQLDHMGEVEE